MPDVSGEVTVVNSLGMHARPAAALVQKTLTFESDIYITFKNNRVNAKSIMGLLTLGAARGRVVGLSPIVGGRPLRGMADRCLAAIGVDTTAEAVGRHYGARSAGGLLDGWLVHTGDTADVPGVDVRAVPLLMSSAEASAQMARDAVDLATG